MISIVFISMLLFPIIAFANAAPPRPIDIHIAIDDYSNIKKVFIQWSRDGVQYVQEEEGSYPQETRRRDERIFSFVNDEGQYKSFKLRIIFMDGKLVESNAAEYKEWGTYIYHVKDNVLETGPIISWKIDGYFYAMGLLLPLICTLLIEWLISLAFKLKPGNYVVIANMVTNPIMNILLLKLFNRFFIDYYLILLIVEILVAVLEFIFYRIMYAECSKKRLSLFVVLANSASWGIYYLISNQWFA